MIESGSLTPGVTAQDFGAPPRTALRIELPAPMLRPFLNYYHVFDSDHDVHVTTRALPAWPMLRFIMTDAPQAIRIGNRRYDPLPHAALYGCTGRSRLITTHGGVTVGASLSPLGWARMFPDASADVFRDQVVALDTMLPPATVQRIREALRAMRGPHEIKAVFDELLAPLLTRAHPREAEIERVAALLDDDAIRDIGQLAEAAGMTSVALRRLALRVFGFPAKTLLLRARFLRTFVPMLIAGEPDYRRIDGAYFDTSHFLRDAHRFLGVTPRRFFEQDPGFTAAIARAVRSVRAADARAVADPSPALTPA